MELLLQEKCDHRPHPAQSERELLVEGQIGTVLDVPIVIDPNLPCSLPVPPSEKLASLTFELRRIGATEDAAEQLGY